MIAVRAVSGGPMVGHEISELPQLVRHVEMRFVATYRIDVNHVDQRVVCASATGIRRASRRLRWCS